MMPAEYDFWHCRLLGSIQRFYLAKLVVPILLFVKLSVWQMICCFANYILNKSMVSLQMFMGCILAEQSQCVIILRDDTSVMGSSYQCHVLVLVCPDKVYPILTWLLSFSWLLVSQVPQRTSFNIVEIAKLKNGHFIKYPCYRAYQKLVSQFAKETIEVQQFSSYNYPKNIFCCCLYTLNSLTHFHIYNLAHIIIWFKLHSIV